MRQERAVGVEPLSMADVAMRLRLKPRFITVLADRHGVGVFAGRTRLFSHADVDLLRVATSNSAPWGTVYVVGFADYVKIGFSGRDRLKARLGSIQSCLPVPLITYGAIATNKLVEAELHARFAALRLQGEWFRREGELATWIAEGCPR